MARAQSISTPTVIFDSEKDGGPCKKFFVGCNPDSVDGVDIFVDGIHQSGKPFPMYVESSIIFESHYSDIKKVTATPVGVSTIVDSGIVAK